MWELGKPVGKGGPWKETAVKAGQPSDPFLMTGYDRKSLQLSAADATSVTIEVDITGTGHWQTYKVVDVASPVEHMFPDEFQAYWVRFKSSADTVATAQLSYE